MTLQMPRMLRCQRDHALAVGEIQRQRLFAEHMLARVAAPAMICSACSDVGVTRNTASISASVEQFVVVVVEAPSRAALSPRPARSSATGLHAATSVRARDAIRQILRVSLAQTTQADHIPNPRSRRLHAASQLDERASRAMTASRASASSSAFTPSSIVVRTGLPS